MRLIAYAVGSLLLLLLLFGVPFATYELIEDRALEGNAVIVTATAGTAVATVVLAVLTTISARAAAKAAAMSAEALAYSTQPLIVPIPEELPGDYNVPEVGRNYILRFPVRNVGNGAAILERVDPPGGERFRTPDRTHLPQVTVQPGEVTRLWFEWRADADEIRPDWDFGDNTIDVDYRDLGGRWTLRSSITVVNDSDSGDPLAAHASVQRRQNKGRRMKRDPALYEMPSVTVRSPPHQSQGTVSRAP